MNHKSIIRPHLSRATLTLSLSLMTLGGARAEDIRIDIDGMFCATCEPKVSGALNALPFLTQAKASTPWRGRLGLGQKWECIQGTTHFGLAGRTEHAVNVDTDVLGTGTSERHQ